MNTSGSARRPRAKKHLSAAQKALHALATLYPGDVLLSLTGDAQALLGQLAGKYQDQLSLCCACQTPEQVRRLRYVLPSIDVMYGQTDELPWPPERFDVILCEGLSEVLRKGMPALREISRVLAPGAQLLLAFRCYPGFLRPLVNSMRRMRGDMPVPSRHEITARFRKAGFVSVDVLRYSPSVAVVVAWKQEEPRAMP